MGGGGGESLGWQSCLVDYGSAVFSTLLKQKNKKNNEAGLSYGELSLVRQLKTRGI